MRMLGRVEQYLLDKIKAEGSIHMTLIDPEKVTTTQAIQIAEHSQASGSHYDWRFNLCFSRPP
jgi:phosphoglycerol geranylgeranyltransferase